MVNDLRVAHKLLAVSGLSPWSPKRRWQWCQRCYTLLVTVIYLICTVVGLTIVPWDESVLSNFTTILIYVCKVVSWFAISLECALTYEQHFAFLERSQRIKDIFDQRLHVRICLSSLRQRQLRKTILYLLFTYGVLCLKVFALWRYETFAYFYLLTIPAIFVIRQRCLQYIIYMDYIALYAQILNTELTLLVSYKMHSVRTCRDDRLASLEHLSTLKQLYGEIHAFTMLFCESFGWSLVCTFNVMFFDMLVNTYWAFMALCDSNGVFIVFLTQLTVLPLIMVITMACYSAEQCRRQGKAAQNHVQCLLCCLQRDGKAAAYMDMVSEFTLQLMQQPLEINAKQYFTLGLRLQMEMFVALFTYLVILLQFSSSSV